MFRGSRDISQRDLQARLELIVNNVGSLEEKERKLIKSFDSVLEDFYMLPVSILGICTGVSGLFLIDSKIPVLFLVVMMIALSFGFAVALSLRFAQKQLDILKRHGTELVSERSNLYLDFERLNRRIMDDNLAMKNSTDLENQKEELATDFEKQRQELAMKKLADFEKQNEELLFVMSWYDRSLWLIAACGVVYIVVFVIGGFHVFWRHSG